MLKMKKFKWLGIEFDDYDTIEAKEEGQPRIYKTDDGNFPSVTSLLKVFDDGFLEKWKKRVGEEEANRIMKESSEIGNALHDYSELYLNNKLDKKIMKGKARHLFSTSKKYLDDIDYVVGTEVALYNKDDKYAGRSDAIGIIDDKLCIIDHKNSRQPIDMNKKWCCKKLSKYIIQTTSYRRAFMKMKGYDASHGCLIVGNVGALKSDRFIYPLEPFEKEVDIMVDAYYNDINIAKQSIIFSENIKDILNDIVIIG